MGALAPAGVIGHEVLEIAAIVEQFLGAQPIYELVDHRGVVSLAEQLAAQLFRGVIAPREGIERRGACRAGVERIYFRPALRRLGFFGAAPRLMVAFSGISLARICASMSLEISGCCCKKVRTLSLPCPMRSPL